MPLQAVFQKGMMSMDSKHSAIATRSVASGVVPSLEEVREIASQAARDVRTVPVYREVLADMETPVSVY